MRREEKKMNSKTIVSYIVFTLEKKISPELG